MKRALLAISSTVVGLCGLFSYDTPTESIEAQSVGKVLDSGEPEAAGAVLTELGAAVVDSTVPTTSSTVVGSPVPPPPAVTAAPTSSATPATSSKPVTAHAPLTPTTQGGSSAPPSTSAPTTQKPVTTTTTAKPTTTTTVDGPIKATASAGVVSPGHGTITVTVTVSNQRVTACVASASGLVGDSLNYSKQANLDTLCAKAVATNYSQVSKVGGATLTTSAFNKALLAARIATGI